MDEFGVDLERIARLVDRAKVLDVFLEVVGKSLLIDFRAAGSDHPFATVLPKASSRRERMRTVKALRPSAPLPDRIGSVVWPRGVAALSEAGVVERIERRLTLEGFDPQAVLGEALEQLAADERAVYQSAVRGSEGFQTVWERRG